MNYFVKGHMRLCVCVFTGADNMHLFSVHQCLYGQRSFSGSLLYSYTITYTHTPRGCSLHKVWIVQQCGTKGLTQEHLGSGYVQVTVVCTVCVRD